MAFERTEGSRPARPMRRGRKKVCSFCVDRIDTIDYKDVPRLRKYVSERAKIIPRLSLIHISERAGKADRSRMPSSA